MPSKFLTVLVPAEMLEKIDEHARSQYLSRSAAVRQIIMTEIERRRRGLEEVEPEGAAS
jgi:metal-responsive CopG/Arc/MetJ family transcriptional regulator